MRSSHLPLRRFQFRDALITAPVSLSITGIVLRMLDACLDGIYGSLRPDVLIVGNDPLVALCCALHHAEEGKMVLLAPDTLDTKSWPNPDYAANALAIFNTWDELLGLEVARQFPELRAPSSLPACLSALSSACVRTGRVRLVEGASLQTSHGFIRGAGDREVLFPLRPGVRDSTGLNPAWKYISRRLDRIIFNHRELEFISAGSVVLTSHPSSFVSASTKAFCRVGQARISKPEVVDALARVDDLRSAKSAGTSSCSQD